MLKLQRTSDGRHTTAYVMLGGALSLACLLGACSSPVAYPSRNAAITTSLTDIEQLLRSAHFTGSWRKTQTEGPCDETDSAHGALVISAGSIDNLTGTQGSQLLTTALTVWHADGYSDVSENHGNPGDDQVTAKDGVYLLEVDVESDGDTGIFIDSCYSTPGPATATTTQTIMSPLSGGNSPESSKGASPSS